MSTIWRIISVLAVANLVAIIGLIGWLATSDRLDGSRVRALRATLSETLSEQRRREAEAAMEAESAQAQLDEAARLDQPPLTFTEQFALKLDRTAMDQQRIELMERQVEDLRGSVQVERQQLASERETFERERAAFQATRERLQATEGSEQFRKAVGVLEGLKPAESVGILTQLIGGRVAVLGGEVSEAEAPERGIEQAVSYLNAMQARVRTKVMNEFTKRDEALAADLLERLRTRGLNARVAGAEVDD